MKKVGPNTLQDLLSQLGLELQRTRTRVEDSGKRPELIMCEFFNITVADPSNTWVDHEIAAPGAKQNVSIGDAVEVEVIRSIDQSRVWLPGVVADVRNEHIQVNISGGDRMSVPIYSLKWRHQT